MCTNVCYAVMHRMYILACDMRARAGATYLFWLQGDTTNLLGCLLQGQQLPTTTYTAM